MSQEVPAEESFESDSALSSLSQKSLLSANSCISLLSAQKAKKYTI